MTRTPQGSRVETDSFGPIEVPADRYWGAQTERSLRNFRIGTEHMPIPLIRALAIIKLAAAEVNHALGSLDARRSQGDRARRPRGDRRQARRSLSPGRVADRFRHPDQHERERGDRGARQRNARRRAGRQCAGASQRPRQHEPVVERQLSRARCTSPPPPRSPIPVAGAGASARARSSARRKAFAGIIKIGRTHTQDATPLTLGQEFSGYAAAGEVGTRAWREALKQLYPLAQGGTAVGTGLNAKPRFAKLVAKRISGLTGLPFVTAPNKFEALASHDAIVFAHGALTSVATGLFKIANDVRLLGSGPRAGLGELILPENEPGSSIMPGKVNPTQCEAVTMVCCQVFGNNTTITMAGSQGHFELNVYKPVIAYAMLQSIRLLADVAVSFTDNCVSGIRADQDRIRELMERSLMLVTALAPRIGYQRAAEIAKAAHAAGTTLREEAIRLGYVSAADFDRLVRPEKMIRPG